MADWHEDYSTFYARQREEIEDLGLTREELIEDLKGSLRNIKQLLPNYKFIQERKRYQMTVDDVDAATQMCREYAGDDLGLFEYDDIIETVIEMRSKQNLIVGIMDQYSRGEWTTPRD